MAIVVGLFEQVDQAQAAVQALTERGVGREHLSVVANDAHGEAAQAVGASVPEHQAHSYAEGVRRGGTLVTVHTDGGFEPTVRDILHAHGAVDIEAHAAEWPSGGRDGFRGDDIAPTTEIPEHRAHDAPDDRTGIPADTTIATSVGALTGGAIPGGYGPAGATLFGDDAAASDRKQRD